MIFQHVLWQVFALFSLVKEVCLANNLGNWMSPWAKADEFTDKKGKDNICLWGESQLWSLVFFNRCSVQLSSATQSCPTLCDPMNHSTRGLPVHHQLPESTQTHVHWISDAIQPSHPLSSPSPPVLNLSQHQGLFKWVSSSHQVAKVLEFHLQHQSFQWTPRSDLL